MSKNLNRPFFMDFLAQVSLRFVEEAPESEEDDDTGCNQVINCYFQSQQIHDGQDCNCCQVSVR